MLGGAALACLDYFIIAGLPASAQPADYLQPNFGIRRLGSIGLLAMVAGAGFFFARPATDFRIRWMALCGLASFAGYSLIPY